MIAILFQVQLVSKYRMGATYLIYFTIKLMIQ